MRLLARQYTLNVKVDMDAWRENYGCEFPDVEGDIDMLLSAVIPELVNEWIQRTGNSGEAALR